MRINKKFGLEKLAFNWGDFMNGLAAGQTLGNVCTPQPFVGNVDGLRVKPLEEIEQNNKNNAIAGGVTAAALAAYYGIPYVANTALPAVGTYAMANPTIAAGVGATSAALSKVKIPLNYLGELYSRGGPKLLGLARAGVHPIEQGLKAINAFRAAPVSSSASTVSTGLSLNALNDTYARVDEDYITPVKEYIYPHFRDEVYPKIKNLDIDYGTAIKDYIWPYAKDMGKELWEISKAKAKSRRTGEPISSSLYENKRLDQQMLWSKMTEGYRERKTIPYPSMANELGIDNPVLSLLLDTAMKGHVVTSGTIPYINAWKMNKDRSIPYLDAVGDQLGQALRIDYLRENNK